MPRTARSLAFFSFVLGGVLSFCLSPLWAKEKPVPEYPLSGKVLASSAKGTHSYQIATDSRIYLMMCMRVSGFHWGMAECKVNDKPIAVGDTIQFRVDGDKAFMPDLKGEEELRVLTTEFKVIPELAPAAAGESGKDAGSERAQVIGTGVHIRGQKMVAWSTDPSSVKRPSYNGGSAGSMAPVMAIPVTGGAPVMMMPTMPSSGAFVMGVPATGGAPVMGVRMGGPAMGGGGPPPWVHILRVRAGESLYVLECPGKACEVDKKQIELGDTVLMRAEKKWAFVSSEGNSGGKEAKFRILNETEDEPASDTQ